MYAVKFRGTRRRFRPKWRWPFRCADINFGVYFVGAEDKGRRGEAEGGRDRSQVALGCRDYREEGEQQAERAPGGAPAARESNYTDAGPTSIAAAESLQRSRLVKRNRTRRYAIPSLCVRLIILRVALTERE